MCCGPTRSRPSDARKLFPDSVRRTAPAGSSARPLFVSVELQRNGHDFVLCIRTMNPPLTPPRRGTGTTRTYACSPPRRGWGWVGSWNENSRREVRWIGRCVGQALVGAGGSFLIAVKLPSSQQRTNPSVTDFSSSQRARMFFASCLVIWLSVAAVAMTASRSANS